ncbi:MAG: MFS transporter [Acidimicrobiia bacterium]|nr:MFS transporter [Acidimicrobiia bacterium]
MTEPSSTPSTPPGFAVIWSTVAIDQVGFGIIIPVLALYAEDFGASPTTIGFLVATFALAQLITAPIGGRLSDRFGRKPVILFSLLGTAVGSLITGFAGSVWMLFLGRAVDGSSGASVVVSQAAVTDIVAPQDRARLLGRLAAAFGFGFALGPAIGGLAASVAGPRAPFFVAAGLAATNAVVAWFRLPETLPPERRISSRPAAAEEGRPRIEWHQRLLRLFAVALVASTAFAMFTTTIPLLLERRAGLDEGGVGIVFACVGVGIMLASTFAVGPAVETFGSTGVVRVGLLFNMVGLLLLGPDAVWIAIVPSTIALILGQALQTGPQSALVSNTVGANVRGSAMGVNQASVGVGRVVGPIAGGVLFQVGLAWPYLVGAVLTAIALALVPGPAASR